MTERKNSVVKKKHTVQPGTTKDQRSPTGTRLLQVPQRVWYNPLTWHHHPPVPAYAPLPKARQLFWAVLKLLWANKKLFAGIVLVYGLLNIVLVRGLSDTSNLSSVKNSFDAGSSGISSKAVTAVASFGYLLAGSGSGNGSESGVYQAILLILCSLAVIWALRQVLAGHTARVRDSFYQGMYPLVPFLLLFLLLSAQLLPMVIGGSLYSLVSANGIAVHLWEKTFWLLLFIGLSLWSLRMITVTLFAFYIVTLPDMAPLKAYRSARQLVYGRRLLIWRKLIFLPVVLLVLGALIEAPFILLVTPVAAWLFFVLGMAALPIVHAYLYNLYRDLL